MEAQPQQLAAVLDAHPVPRGPERLHVGHAVTARLGTGPAKGLGGTVAFLASLTEDGQVALTESVLGVGGVELRQKPLSACEGGFEAREVARRVLGSLGFEVVRQTPERFDGRGLDHVRVDPCVRARGAVPAVQR